MSTERFDVVVVGGGPAGLIAAGAAAASGGRPRVLVLEKNPEPGRKLLLSGGGRCNFTNAEMDTHRLVGRYDEAGKALFSPFSRMGPREVLDFFAGRGMPHKIEDQNRAFPRSDSSRSVLEVLLEYIREGAVELRTRCTVDELVLVEGCARGVRCNGRRIDADAVVLATGGLARPDTGSTGDGFIWLERCGHHIVRPEPSLVPIVVEEPWVRELQGIAFPEVRITLRLGGVALTKVTGKVLFTHFGLSGPGILNLATQIAAAAEDGSHTGTVPEIGLNFFPDADGGRLDRCLQDALAAHPRRRLKTVLETMVPPRLARRVLMLADSSPAAGAAGGVTTAGVAPRPDVLELAAATVPKALRKRIVAVLQNFPLTFRELQSEDWAVVSSGGVPTDEVDFRRMESKLVPGLFITGDMLNINRPSGGFSLQICWATGFVAGETAGAVDAGPAAG